MLRKKVLPVLAVLALVAVLVGCFNRGNTAQNAALQNEFSLIASISYQGIQAKGTVSKAGECYQLQITEPEALSGMGFEYDGEKVNVSYLGLSVGVDKNTILTSAAASIVSSFNHALIGSGTNVKNDGDNFVITGKTESGAYKLTASRMDGTPVSLELPDSKLSCAISKPEG